MTCANEFELKLTARNSAGQKISVKEQFSLQDCLDADSFFYPLLRAALALDENFRALVKKEVAKHDGKPS